MLGALAVIHGRETKAAADLGALHPELRHQVSPFLGLIHSKRATQSVLSIPLLQGEGGHWGGGFGWNRLEAYGGLSWGQDGGLRGRLRLRANGELGGRGRGGQGGQAVGTRSGGRCPGLGQSQRL